MEAHPVRLHLEGDLRRSRLTVFFRLLLALPHFVWIWLWGYLAQTLVVVGWVIALVTGRVPVWLHDFLTAYVRYNAHLLAFLSLAGAPYPGFTGAEGSYPVDVEIPAPERQSRWTILFRLPLLLPALLLVAAITAVVWVAAILGWFAALVLGRMPKGLRDLAAYGVGYSAQLNAYVYLLTSRYPTSDPERSGPSWRLSPEPLELVVEETDRRSRLTVLFRFLLALPHGFWLYLWTIPAVAAAVAAWLSALLTGRVPAVLHRFLAAYVRYMVHVYAFFFLVANPFPGFTGKAGSYPVDLVVPPPERQSRWVTLFRVVLAIPALLLGSALSYVLYAIAFLGWFAALVTGRMPSGLRNLGAAALRYHGQTWGYLGLLTSRYPHASPAIAPARDDAPPAPDPVP